MTYRQLTPGERHAISALRKQGLRQADIARALGRHPSTISREIRRNMRTPGCYRPGEAIRMTRARRSRSRRNRRFRLEDWVLICSFLKDGWSPEQIAGRLRETGVLWISHETIYRYIWADKKNGGSVYKDLRGARKKRWKRYRSYDSRGRLAGKRPIAERPPVVERRLRIGDLEGDTVMGGTDRHCILTLVDRKSGYTLIGKLPNRTAEETTKRAIFLLERADRETWTITVDNGTEFHNYMAIEEATGATIYFATPHHSWERGTNENTNGLIRQYLPKRQSMARLTQADCDQIAQSLNNRPRKRLGWLTPAEVYERQL